MTYLAPSIPLKFFRELAAYLADAVGTLPELLVDESRSGPRYDETEPFSTAEADLAFVCSTSYVWLADRRPPPVELLGAATVPGDPRAAGRPVYFADVVSRAGSGYRRSPTSGRSPATTCPASALETATCGLSLRILSHCTQHDGRERLRCVLRRFLAVIHGHAAPDC